jgi:hypothetical protein
VKENLGWMLITIAMLVTIMLLHGCTRFDTSNVTFKWWDIEVESLPTGECRATVSVNHDTHVSDESVEITNPKDG